MPFTVIVSPRMFRLPNSCSAISKPTIATRDTCSSSCQVKLRPYSSSIVRMSWYCGSMPVTRAAAALYALFTFTAPRSISGLTTAIIDDSAAIARASSSVRRTSRPARSPPACRLVRPPQTMPMFFPSSRSTLSLPRRNPSPVADRTTTEIMPQRMPNIVRQLRSLFARRFWTDCRMASVTLMLVGIRDSGFVGIGIRWTREASGVAIRSSVRIPNPESRIPTRSRRQNHPVALLEAVEDLDLRAVADADLHGHLLSSGLRTWRDDVNEGVFLGVVGDGGFRHDQRVGVLLEHDLRVRGHVRLQLFAGVVDRHAHLEVGDVVLFDAHRRDLCHAAVERLVLERFDADPRLLTEPHAADVRLVHLAADEDLIDVAERHDERRVRAQIQDRRHGAADLHVAREDRAANRG